MQTNNKNKEEEKEVFFDKFNKQLSPKTVSLVFSILILCFVIGFYVIAWIPPDQSPPGGNVPAPLNVGPDGQEKAGGLILNTGGAENGLIVDKGNVGIGITNPTRKLEVNGYVKGQGLCIRDDCRVKWPSGGSSFGERKDYGGMSFAATFRYPTLTPADGYAYRRVASADGFVVLRGGGSSYTIEGQVLENGSWKTRAQINGSEGDSKDHMTFTMPVRRGESWRIHYYTKSTDTQYINDVYFIPLISF